MYFWKLFIHKITLAHVILFGSVLLQNKCSEWNKQFQSTISTMHLYYVTYLFYLFIRAQGVSRTIKIQTCPIGVANDIQITFARAVIWQAPLFRAMRVATDIWGHSRTFWTVSICSPPFILLIGQTTRVVQAGVVTKSFKNKLYQLGAKIAALLIQCGLQPIQLRLMHYRKK